MSWLRISWRVIEESMLSFRSAWYRASSVFLPVSDVPDDPDDEPLAGCIGIPGLFRADRVSDPGRVRDALLVLIFEAGLEYLFIFCPEHRSFFRFEKIIVGLPDQCLPGVPGKVAETVIDCDEPVVAILDEEGIGQGVDNGVEIGF